jgi:hypothetical protein
MEGQGIDSFHSRLRNMVSRPPSMFKALFLGLCIAQILATAQVYLSDAQLYRNLVALRNAGYLTVPNQKIMQTLPDFGAAFFGGLFFTVSVGAGITLLSLGAVWLWDRLFHRAILGTLLLVAIWVGCLVMVNIGGIDLMVSAYFLCIPGAVLFVTVRRMPAGADDKRWRPGIVWGAPVLVLAALWLTQMDAHLFLDVRDHLLLSNRFGTRINDFYYTYTLYPAEVFKSLDQKVLNTYCLEHVRDPSLTEAIEQRLVTYDYLRLEGEAPVDVTISQRGSFLALGNRQRDVLKVSSQAFFAKTGKLLRELSVQTDTHRFFRRFTFFSLLIGFPIALYLVFMVLFRALGSLFLSMRASSLCASGICLAIGIALFAFFVHSRVKSTEIRDVAAALESRRWQEKVAALKLIGKESREVGDFRAYGELLESPCIPVRYWLARSMGVSRKPETYDDLVRLLNDPHPNVVSMALHALGKRGNTRAISVILDHIGASNDWYSQWYAYKALRRLGWKQTGLP